MLYPFGRVDQLDRAATTRPITAVTRLLDTGAAAGAGAGGSDGMAGLEFTEFHRRAAPRAGEEAGVGAEVRAVLADGGVGAGSPGGARRQNPPARRDLMVGRRASPGGR